MSKCIIQIKIGDQIVTLDPLADINGDDSTAVVHSIDVNKLKLLFNNIKSNVDLDKLFQRNLDDTLIAKGEAHYDSISSNEFITPLGAILREKDTENRKALTEYVNSLDTKQVLESGNYLLDAKQAYKLSRYTHRDVERLFFKSNSNMSHLFSRFMNMPGMETIRISVAFATELHGEPVTMVKGSYIAPDNIIQLIVPTNYQIKSKSGDKLMSGNFKTARIPEISGVLIHELAHAVFSELYISDPTFKRKMDVIHDEFLKRATGANIVLTEKYKDVHEFFTDLFISNKLQRALSQMPVLGEPREGEFKSLYRDFIGGLSETIGAKESLLKDAVSLLAASMPTGDLTDKFQETTDQFVNSDHARQTIFFTPGEVDQEGINRHISPNDYTTTYGGINAQAFWVGQEFLKRHDVDNNEWTIRDAYYNATVNNPSPSQLDRLNKQDLVSIPWLRYIKADKESGIEGRWQEQGVLVDGKNKPVLKEGKLQIVDLLRDDKGEIIQDKKANGGLISPRTKLVPIVYTNSKQQKVIVAKVGVTDRNGYNTVSLPYNMIKGYRTFDRTYFNHNENFQEKLDELIAERELSAKNNEGEVKEDLLFELDQRIAIVRQNLENSLAIKEKMKEEYRNSAFSYKNDDDVTVMNVTESDFRAAKWGKDGTERIFADADNALYTITKDKDGKYRSRPNPQIFRTLWEGDSAKQFVKDSEGISVAIANGDMIRVSMKTTIEVDKEKVTVDRDTWLPVFARLANGIEVATQQGTGMIIPFNKIDAYAKNIKSEAFVDLALKVRDIKNSFEEDMYVEVEGKKKLNKEFISSNIKFKTLQFNEKYNNKNEDTEEEARARFDKNLAETMKLIIPYESFVKVKRKFLSKGSGADKGTIQEYQTNELVIAKTDEGLLVMGDKGGKFNFEYIKFSEQLADTDNYGRELAFLMQDISAVSKVWEEFENERNQYENVKDKPVYVNEGTKESPKWKFVAEGPRNNRDVYDMYDKVDGTTISRLQRGDIIAIKMDKKDNDSKLPDFYYRKVVSVHDNGSVTVAEFAKKDKKFESGFTIKAGVYPKTIATEKIVKVGYKLGAIEGDKDTGYVSEFHQDLISRRQRMMEYAKKDVEFDDFIFAPTERAVKFNNAVKNTEGHHKRFVRLTNKILSPKSTEDLVYLNKQLQPVSEAESTWVMSWYKGDTLRNVVRGINANTTFFKQQDITYNKGKYVHFKPEILNELMPGDWVVKEYRGTDGKMKQFSSLIERIEGGQIYTLAQNFSTFKVDARKIIGVRTSVRNDKFSGFTRSNKLLQLIKNDKADTRESKVKQSMDADYKSPKDSRRALFEFGNRFQELNPDVKMNYLEQAEVNTILRQVGYDYSNTRAFVLDGEVNINLERASISDVVHEYAHLFLHALKYENPDMYESIISSTITHPLYNQISREYKHLSSQEDVNEEVFVTLLGEQIGGRMKDQLDTSLLTEFDEYTKTKMNQLMGVEADNLYSLEAKDIMQMRLEDIINLVGDQVIKNRIYDIYDNPAIKFTRDLKRLKQDLRKLGLLTETCYE